MIKIKNHFTLLIITGDQFGRVGMVLPMDKRKNPAVYIMASRRNGTLYTGVTSDLERRIYEHKEGRMDGFTKQYQCKLLVWYELYDEMIGAIAREKQIKAGSRKKKLYLIETMNPNWDDLYAILAQ